MRERFFIMITASILLCLLLPLSASAKINGGTKNITVGEETKLEAEGPGHTVSGTWSVNGNSCYISSRSNRSCTVTGIRAGTSTVTWIGASDGKMEEVYWTIIVTGGGSGGSSGGSGGSSGGSSKADTGFSDSWAANGNYSITWYNASKSEYLISTANELAGLAYLVNNGYSTFKNKVVKLGNDIDLSGKNWTTIGDGDSYNFEGAFDGQNHTISGIYIVAQNDKQQRYGFWAALYQTPYIKNIRLQGRISIENENAVYKGFDEWNLTGYTFVGGIVGFANNVYFENCKSDIDIVFKRNHPNGVIYMGGIAGQCRMSSSNSVAMRYCSHDGTLYASEWSGNSNPPVVGGLIGYSGITGGYAGIIEYCENYSPSIYCNQPNGDHASSSNMRVGGIVGYGRPEIRFCRSVIEDIQMNTPATTGLVIGGIGSDKNMTIINSFSVIKKFSINSVSMYSNAGSANYGGIDAYTSSSASKANYSNSDVSKYSFKTLTEGYHGSTSFSSEQMKTGAFLEELNIYSLINIGKTVWTQQEGDYPYIAMLRETLGISNIKMDDRLSNKIHTLSGQRLNAPKKGINIIGGKKVVVK